MGILHEYLCTYSRSQWPRGLRHRSAGARLLRLCVRIPPRAWMFVCCECCVLSGRGLCDELITRPEESYRLWCVVMCDLETSRMRRPWPALGRSATARKKNIYIYVYICIYIYIRHKRTEYHNYGRGKVCQDREFFLTMFFFTIFYLYFVILYNTTGMSHLKGIPII